MVTKPRRVCVVGPGTRFLSGITYYTYSLIEALAGPDNWGTETTSDGNRVVWIRLGLPPEGTQP